MFINCHPSDTMKISVRITSVLWLVVAIAYCTKKSVQAFLVPQQHSVPNKISTVRLQVQDEKLEFSSPSPSSSVATVSSTQMKEIGLLTFDLDDTLYPIAPVVRDANGA
jgi:hypothetical protein